MTRRIDGRGLRELRPFSITPGFIGQATGSALVQAGRTRVICTASVEPKAPPWLKSGGWVTAQYAMLPGATSPRGSRDPGGRGKEIQRLIGRALRAAVHPERLVGPSGPVSIVCDCDVIEADGGTRTASITGAYVALALACEKLLAEGRLLASPMASPVAAVSVGLVRLEEGAQPEALVDLCYEEDARADVDMNVVAAQGRGLVEVQGTGEQGTFSRAQLDRLLDAAESGLSALFEAQAAALVAKV